MCTNTRPLDAHVSINMISNSNLERYEEKRGFFFCQLPASPPFIFSHWLRLQIFMESKGFVPLCLPGTGVMFYDTWRFIHAHSTLQYKDFNTYVEKSIHKIMQKGLYEDGKSDQKQSPKALTKKLWASTIWGLWVLNLALLQEHFRNGLITWVLIFANSA